APRPAERQQAGRCAAVRPPDRVGPRRGHAQPHSGAESRSALRLRQAGVTQAPELQGRDMSRSISRRSIVIGTAALGLHGFAPRARAAPAPQSSARPLAQRLAVYADGLRYSDIDEATVESVKTHLIDTLGCGIAAFDERPVRICRELAVAA